MRHIFTLAAFVATLFLAPACAHAQVGQIDGRIASTFGGEVDTSAKANGYVLTYQSSTGKWIAAAGGGGFSPTITGVATGDVLRYNGSAWVNVTTSTVLDTVGSTRGSVLYRGASGWAALTPGTSGYFLKSNGAGSDPSWASAGGGGGFDPAAATALTFTQNQSTLNAWSGTSGNDTGSSFNAYGGNGYGSGDGGMVQIISGSGGATGNGGEYQFYTGDGGSTSGDSGSFLIQTGSVTAGNTGGIALAVADAAGTNKSAGNVSIQLGAKTGSGTNSSFTVLGASAATVFKVAYDGTVTVGSGGPTISAGTGSPESVVTAPVGSLFLRTDGSTSTTLYVKTSGSHDTGWTAK